MRRTTQYKQYFYQITASHRLVITAAVLIVSQIGVLQTARSDDEGAWPDEVNYRPYGSAPGYFQPTTNPILQRINAAEAQDQQEAGEPSPFAVQQVQPQQLSPHHPPDKMDHTARKWLFFKKNSSENAKPEKGSKKGLRNPFARNKVRPLTDEEVIQVGPRETQATRDPLLAVPVALNVPFTHLFSPPPVSTSPMSPTIVALSVVNPTDGASTQNTLRVLPAGFYIVRRQDNGPAGKLLTLMQENRVVLQCPVGLTGQASGPLSVTNPQAESAISPIVRVQVNPANANTPQTAIITLTEQGQIYQSEPFAVVTDHRHEWKY